MGTLTSILSLPEGEEVIGREGGIQRVMMRENGHRGNRRDEERILRSEGGTRRVMMSENGHPHLGEGEEDKDFVALVFRWSASGVRNKGGRVH
jgi:hypothetical protein